MRHISVYQKPGYVHGLGLQDALCKARDPDASELDVLARRWDISLVSAAPNEADRMLVLVSGPFDTELAIRLRRAAANVIRCCAPPGRNQPDVHVRFSG